ncbi:Ig-like domain-containing protein [Arthrobacter sp. UYEF6]|uniref:Ig-like domain-containing protein n=1 Tax=unclassified Pseudarthrobacter TaxID=2647000 RepID=UPI003390B579
MRQERNLRFHALLTALLLALGVLMVPVAASAAPGDVGVEGPSHSGTGTPTGTKRQTNSLWFNDGLWWGNLWDTASSDFHIFRFNAVTSSWVNTGVATETRANTHHDVLWDGTTLFVASYKFVNDGLPAQPNFPSTMRRYSYDSSTKKYSLLSTTKINNYRVETLSIDKDSTGRVWATWQQANRIYLNVTATDGKTWGTPFAHPAALSNVSVDDTSAVIAFDGNKMGVMWSRQVGDATDGMYWSYHVDGASNTAWSTPVAAVSGQRSSDDHMNLKWLDSSGGRVFAAVKTSFTSAPQPLIQLLALSGTTWSAYPIATVSECPNRVIVLIDESTQMLRTFASYPKPSGTTNAGVCTTSGGAIYEKSSPLNNISFTTAKTARIVHADQYVHNVTSTKQNLNSAARGTANSGLLVLADVNATSRYWHYYDPPIGGDTTAPTVAGTSPAAGATGVAVTADVTGTFSEAMDAATVTSSTFTLTAGTTTVPAVVSYDSTSKVATLNPGADLAPGTTYTATIKGGSGGVKDVAGNALASDKTWTFTTAPAGGQTGIQRRGMSTLVNTTSTTSHTITKPASAAAGQVCVASLALNGSTVSAAPTGWTQFAAITSIANPHLYGYYHVMGSSEPASYTWTTAGSVASGGGISCYSGVNTTTPLDTTASVAASATAASTGSVPGVTTTTAGAMLVGAVAINSSNTTIAIAGPSDMAEVYDLGGKRTELDDGLQATAGSSGSKSWVWSSGSLREWAGWLVALRAQ